MLVLRVEETAIGLMKGTGVGFGKVASCSVVWLWRSFLHSE